MSVTADTRFIGLLFSILMAFTLAIPTCPTKDVSVPPLVKRMENTCINGHRCDCVCDACNAERIANGPIELTRPGVYFDDNIVMHWGCSDCNDYSDCMVECFEDQANRRRNHLLEKYRQNQQNRARRAREREQERQEDQQRIGMQASSSTVTSHDDDQGIELQEIQEMNETQRPERQVMNRSSITSARQEQLRIAARHLL